MKKIPVLLLTAFSLFMIVGCDDKTSSSNNFSNSENQSFEGIFVPDDIYNNDEIKI